MPKPRVRIQFINRTQWLAKFASGLVVKYELLKSRKVRVKGIYFSGHASSIAQTIDRLHNQGHSFTATPHDITRYCESGSAEIRVTGRVAPMIELERLILAGWLEKLQAKVVPLPPSRQRAETVKVGNRTFSIG